MNHNMIRVLVVDDSAIVRELITEVLSASPDISVVGTASDASLAFEAVNVLRPDVLTLDIDMPEIDGLTFLRRLMRQHPMPVVVISSALTEGSDLALEALRLGAVDVVPKPGGPHSIGEIRFRLPERIRAAAVARIKSRTVHGEQAAGKIVYGASVDRGDLIAIGASTGGTEAILEVLRQLPRDSPPIVVVQHIPPLFSARFADRLNEICRMAVREARDGEPLTTGLALIAPGNRHLLVKGSPGRFHACLRDGPPVNYSRPSVDVLFASVAECAGPHAIGVILTGMGSDGAAGLLRMRRAGAYTIAEDKSTCAVFGMPREAIRLNAACVVAPLHNGPSVLMKHLAQNGAIKEERQCKS